MFLSRNKKNNVYPCKPQFYYIKVGFKGVKITYVGFRDVQIVNTRYLPESSPYSICNLQSTNGMVGYVACSELCLFEVAARSHSRCKGNLYPR